MTFQHLVNCRVKHQDQPGLVIADAGNRIKVRLQTGERFVDAATLLPNWSPGTEVRHQPQDSTQKSLGEGVILRTRNFAGSQQVLVEFYQTGERRWLPYQRLSWFKGPRHCFFTDNFAEPSNAERFRLRTLAHALINWNENTGSLNDFDIDPLPHQVHLVHTIMSKGHYNWLIADDVGLGKTIETGMLIKAMQQRGHAKRILLVTPAGLTAQWKEEMHSKFKLSDFRIYGEDIHINEPREWKMYDHVIGSIDRLKDDKHLELLLQAEAWDLVIFDEAHRLSRSQYGLKLDETGRYKLAKKLRNKTRAMVLLSATPHQGKTDKFQAMLELLHPNRKTDIDMLELDQDFLQDMVIRNNKADVTDAKGNFIFHGKTTRSITVDIGDEARAFDKALQEYFKRGYKAAEQDGSQQSRAIGFVMTVYRKLAASSVEAIFRALIKRKKRLLGELAEAELDDQLMIADERYVGEAEEQASGGKKEFFQGELQMLNELLAMAEALRQNDNKLNGFCKSLIPTALAENPKEKLLIFTEYRATQDHLEAALKATYGEQSVRVINGSMDHQQRFEAIEHFESTGQFLISTEAGGEGINLQDKCHIMVNYDLPWNPMRLVQRIGRLYRYGQQKRVVVFNMNQPDTADANIVSLMYERIDTLVQDMAKVSSEYNEALAEDILGEMADMLEVEEILKNAATETIERTQARIDEALKLAQEATSKQRDLFEFAAKFDAQANKEQLNITTEHVIAFAQGMFDQLDIKVAGRTQNNQVWQLILPEQVKHELGTGRRQWQITFDKKIAAKHKTIDLLSMEHFLMQYLLEKAQDQEFAGHAAACQLPWHTPALVCSYLTWQNEMGERHKQEFSAWHINENGAVVRNSNAFAEWLKSTASPSKLLNKADQNAYKKIEAAMHRRLAQKADRWLMPESTLHVSAAISGTSEI